MIQVKKDDLIRQVNPKQLKQYLDSGWTEFSKEQPEQDVIRPKAPVKSKATVTAVEEANINKGDE